MTKLLESNRIDPATLQISQLSQTPATVAFLGGELYPIGVRSRIFMWCGQLRNTDVRIDTDHNSTLLQELNVLESHAEKIAGPLSYTDELYALRSNIQLVRKKLLRTEGEPA